MRLFRFPSLVHLKIFYHLDLQDLFLLSLCSRKSKKLIKKLKTTKNAQLEVTVSKFWSIFLVVFTIRSDSRSAKIKVTQVIGSERHTMDTFFKIDGFRVDCRISLAELTIIYSSMKSPMIPLLHIIQDIFHCPQNPIFHLRTFQISDFIPPNSIQNSIISNFSMQKTMDFGFFDTPHEFSMIKCARKLIVKKDSGILKNVKNLMIFDVEFSDIPVYLEHFQGEHLFFDTIFPIENLLNGFLKFWMISANDNLKSVIVNTFGAISDENVVLKGLKLQKNRGNQPKMFSYDSVIQHHQKFPEDSFDCTNGYNIQRDTDGKLATVKIVPGFFMFFVR
ncbi:unnamed protein product [Caenorhabditis brenneri]